MIISWRIYDNTRVMILGGERMGISRKFSDGIYDWRSPACLLEVAGDLDDDNDDWRSHGSNSSWHDLMHASSNTL